MPAKTGPHGLFQQGAEEMILGFLQSPGGAPPSGVCTACAWVQEMTIKKDVKGMGMPWEAQYGYAQAVKVGDTIYLAGQLSHDDEGKIVGAPPLDEQNRILDHSNMGIQMRQTYVNAQKLLQRFGATLDNVVEEVLYVTDMDAAFAVAGSVRKQAYGSDKPDVASTILVTPRLALPQQLVEIKFIARI